MLEIKKILALLWNSYFISMFCTRTLNKRTNLKMQAPTAQL